MLPLGSSFGGWIAMAMAHERPTQVAGLILNDIGPEVSRQAALLYMRMITMIRKADDWRTATRLVRLASKRDLPKMDDGFWSEYVRLTHMESGQGIELDMDPAIVTSLNRAQRFAAMLGLLCRAGLFRQVAPAVHGFRKPFSQLSVPILTLRGELSEVLTKEMLERMLKAQPDMISAQIPGRGHAPLLNEAASLAALDTFLEKVLPET